MPEPVGSGNTLRDRIRLSDDNVDSFATRLSPEETISTLFPEYPLEHHIHIFVELSSLGSVRCPVRLSLIKASFFPNKRFLKRVHSDNIELPIKKVHNEPELVPTSRIGSQPPIIQGILIFSLKFKCSPPPPGHWTPRTATVPSLYERLMDSRFIQVCETSALSSTFTAPFSGPRHTWEW